MDRTKIEPQENSPRLKNVQMANRFAVKTEYEAALAGLQKRMGRLLTAYYNQRRRAVVVFEGWDAAGKGGAIRRLTANLDPRGFKVWPIGAPTDVELDQHYLQRFWQRMPHSGTISIFDRSWYGRVLVERVESLVSDQTWGRAYDEINAFEHLLIDDDVRIVKIFMHITKQEQLERFRERLRNPYKRWKLTKEDLRNRTRWADYKKAYQDMFDRTATRAAPWTVIPADHKWTARVHVLEAVAEGLAQGIDVEPPPFDPEVLREAGRELGITVDIR